MCVFALAFTIGRDAFDWETLYALNREQAGVEVLAAFIYLLVTQLVLALFFDVGLHFPGPHVYESGSFAYQHVVVWTLVNTVVYVLVPLPSSCGFYPFALLGAANSAFDRILGSRLLWTHYRQ